MRLALFFCFSFLSFSLWAQPVNDDCLGATFIPTTTEWCSQPMEFTNVGATPDAIITAALQAQVTANCVSQSFQNGIWFVFFPEQPGVLITTDCGLPNGICIRPRAVLFSGSCTASSGLEYVECTPGGSLELSEFTITGLTIGQRYYLYMESEDPGSMQICVDGFIPIPSPESDCAEAVVLCDKSPFKIEFLNTSGANQNELLGFEDECVSAEQSSAWYKWTCKDAGTLSFTLTPNNFINPDIDSDDLDFAVFELPGGLDDCNGKEMVRCMASGACGGASFEVYKICHGPTGLGLMSTDTDEFQGCSVCAGSLPGQPGNQTDDNFVAALDMVAGRSYTLLVNNFSETGRGFSIEFGGTGTFQGPEPDFVPIPVGDTLACDKLVNYNDLSIPGPDPIIAWSWNFGEGANPQTSNQQNPDPVSYDSFGEKSAILTVETSRGCLVTTIIDVRVGACCEDFDPPILETNIEAALCPGEEEAVISYEVNVGGSEEFTYNVSPVNPPNIFLPNPSISGLGAGEYTVIVQDIKGCRDTNVVNIEEFPPVFVNAGMDIELDLGAQDVLSATVDPPGSPVSYEWVSDSNPATSECLNPGLDCVGSDTLDCFDPVVTAQGTQTFTVIITDENGCTSSDQVVVTTNVIRPIYAPTIIGDAPGNRNDIFRLGFGSQVKLVREFHIFDRWGNIIFTADDIELDSNNEMSVGWDGRFGDQSSSRTNFVNPGVYVWYAKILFIDGVILPYAGDVTVIR